MDAKGEVLLYMYKYKIENRQFDELDILGFLIFIRDYIRRAKYNWIWEFSDLIAHRKRNKGNIMSTISNVVDNNFRFDEKTNSVVGAKGILIDEWKNEWKNLGKEFHIEFDEDTIKELTLCIYSLAHKTEYDDEKGHKGIIDLFVNGKYEEIVLGAAENIENESNEQMKHVIIAKYDGYRINKEYQELTLLSATTATKRVGNKLKLFTNYDIVID